MEIAGEVDLVGDDVAELAVGDRVFGIVGGGAYAEQIVVHARALAKVPDALSFVEAAAIPEAFVTAWDAMVEQAHLTAGETVLVHAAASGVGTAAIQIAHAIGARAIGTVRTAEKIARLRELGLTEAVVPKEGAFAGEVLGRTAGRGADVVLDLVGGAYVAESIACVALLGRVVVVGLMAGTRAEIDLASLLHKRVELRGTVLRARPLEEKILAAQWLDRRLAPLFAARTLRPVVDRVFPLASAADAHRAMQKNETFGKLVLEV
jgi:NADPH:quinone reductase